MSTSNLPPLRNLPSWSRVRDLDRVRYPRLLSSDCMVRCPSVNIKSPKAAARPCVDEDGKRITSLQKDILFLQQQHKDTLERLHAEIDHLKRVNKELQYQLVMEHQHSPKGQLDFKSANIPTDSVRSYSNTSKSTSEEKNSQCGSISSEEVREEAAGSVGGAVTSLLPLRITCSPSQHPRTPTKSECEVIIRQLHHANISQYQELVQVKNILRDVVLNKKKSSVEAVSLARACLCDNTRTDAYQRFPKLPLKSLPKKQHPSQSNREETLEKFLPAIKRNFSSSMSERQRKAQDVHKMRFRRTRG
ncbi:coiled-coil domain-containing protein 74A isoform X2 [Triplophysa dalaica]|uniref:coiled-coil domain-containing protein 74A isoform X2 n=1 Tax=Triplophysa dalaica TaxID=1582913 RepID=UPI0024DF6B68|nr:coiled-coil domain-containing protein 74A isoform X2 [Triplophysa dalaica]